MKICERCGKGLHGDDWYLRKENTLCESCAHEYDHCPNKGEFFNHSNQTSILQAKSIVNNSANSWIKIMKTLTIIELIIMLIASIPIAIFVSEITDSNGMGFLAFVLSIIISIASVGLTMVFLNLAEDVSIIREFIRKDFVDKDN